MKSYVLTRKRFSRRESLKGIAISSIGAVAGTRWLGACGSPAREIDAPTQVATPAQAPPASAAAVPPRPVTAGTVAAAPPAMTSAGARAASPAGAGATTPASAGQGGTVGQTAGGPAAPVTSAANGGMSAGAPAPSAGAAAQSTAGAGAVAAADVPWAAGGTKTMTGPYPDPFDKAGSTCRVYPAQTLGPCYADSPAMREDISDGASGLPTRLSFLVVQADGCTPVAGATVDIWHSGFDGVYSAFGAGVCNPDSLDVENEMFCRGVQTTDEAGRANFSTIFPGWYSGRSVHIHFTVRVNGTGEATSQLYFEDDLTTEIQAQGEYEPRGMRPTTNATDFIFRSGGGSPDEVTMSTVKRPDGSLHAWKVIAIG